MDGKAWGLLFEIPLWDDCDMVDTNYDLEIDLVRIQIVSSARNSVGFYFEFREICNAAFQ